MRFFNGSLQKQSEEKRATKHSTSIKPSILLRKKVKKTQKNKHSLQIRDYHTLLRRQNCEKVSTSLVKKGSLMKERIASFSESDQFMRKKQNSF